MPATVLAVLNPKGGSGKSTLATNLARALQLTGRNVLVVDADPQGTARDWRQTAGDDVDLPPVFGVDRPTLEKDIPKVASALPQKPLRCPCRRSRPPTSS